MATSLEFEERALLAKLERTLVLPVEMHLFTQSFEWPALESARQAVERAAAASDLIDLRIHDFQSERALARRLGVDAIPTTLIGRRESFRCRFLGAPVGWLYPVLLEDLLDVSRGDTPLTPGTLERLGRVRAPLRLQAFADPESLASARAGRLAHQIALTGPKFQAEVISVPDLPELADAARVHVVPTVVVNSGVLQFEGLLPEPSFVSQVLRAIGGVEEAPADPPSAAPTVASSAP